MIHWSGWGLLSIPIGAAGLAAGVLMDPLLTKAGAPQQSGLVLAWAGAAAVNWIVGKRLNGRPARELIDVRTGERLILKPHHALYWIPMQYYSIPMLLLGALALAAALGPILKPASG